MFSFIQTTFLAAVVLLSPGHSTTAYTTPDQIQMLLDFKAKMIETRGDTWKEALKSWTCDPNPDQCDPWGSSPGKDGGGLDGSELDGIVTNMHISDMRVTGTLPEELCWFKNLRELDMDGGSLTGPLPYWLATCFSALAELDLSYNQLTGTIPDWISKLSTLAEFEVGRNRMTGRLPDALGRLKSITALELSDNQFTGQLPASMTGLPQSFSSLLIDNNRLSGDLSTLRLSRPIHVAVHNNTNLCGMVPTSIKYAADFDITNTRLGMPC